MNANERSAGMDQRKDPNEKSRRPDELPTTEGRPGLEKDPSDWVTGDEPMTGAQASYLRTLGRRTGEDVPDELTKAEASERIDELREHAGLDDT
jgi:hypothetical protein